MKMYFKHKRKPEGWPYDWRCQNHVEVCFYCVNCHFWQNIFHNKVSICGHAHFIFFVRIYIHLKCYTPSDVHLIMSMLCEMKWLKKLMHQKRNKILFSLMFSLCFLKFGLNLFFICVLIIWLSFMHHIINMQHMFYVVNPFILLQTCFKWHAYSSFKREENDLNIQTIYIC